MSDKKNYMQVEIIGAGFIGELHALAIQQVVGIEVKAACRTNWDPTTGHQRRPGLPTGREARPLRSVLQPDKSVLQPDR